MNGRLIGAVLIHGSALALILTTLALVGQPVYANDTWVHLALGEHFAAQGPFLVSDPHLFAAAGPPSPSSWLGSIALFEIQSLFGFTGLRLFHGAFVGLIFVLAWVVIARVGASKQAASAGLVFFIVLSTYRIVQLRPDLFSMAATLALFLLLIARRSGPNGIEITAAVLLSAFWANVHAAFLLGPLLILGVSLSLLAIGFLPRVSATSEDRTRAGRLGLAGGLMLIASGLNPQGWKAHLAYFSAGGETLALGAVADEWGPTNLFAAPLTNLPPTWAAWIVCWLCVFAIGLSSLMLFRELRAGVPARERTIDPAALALAVAGMIAAIVASRFLWLGIFAVAVGSAAVIRLSSRLNLTSRTFSFLPVFVGIVAAGWLHFSAGDWVLVSRSFRAAGADYRQPYSAGRFYGHALWFLKDSGVEGRIYNAYPLGGIMSFWLSPELQMSSSGSMNVARESMEANLAIASRRGIREGEDFLGLLDRQGIDLFLGTGLPIEAIAGRRDPSTVHHLEGDASWILIFRSLRSAVYLRRNPRNAENLARVAGYYAHEGVPFDSDSGFDPEAVISRATDWAISHGIIPLDFPPLIDSVRANAAARRPTRRMHRAAAIYATLGLYDRALAIDRRILEIDQGNLEAARRAVWCRLRQGRYEDALQSAEVAESASRGDGAAGWRSTVQQIVDAEPDDGRRMLSFIPLYLRDRATIVQIGMVAPIARTDRSPNHP